MLLVVKASAPKQQISKFYLQINFCVCARPETSVLPSFPTNRYCVHDSKYGAHTRCCKGHVYDQRKNVCCNGIQPLVANYTWCCGGLMYNPKYHVCCPDNVIRYNVYFPYTGCCGSIVYRSDSLMLVYLKTVQCACLSVIRIYRFLLLVPRAGSGALCALDSFADFGAIYTMFG